MRHAHNTAIVPLCLIEYVFGDCTARVEFSEEHDVVIVVVTFAAESARSIEQQQAGWHATLDRFTRHAEAMP